MKTHLLKFFGLVTLAVLFLTNTAFTSTSIVVDEVPPRWEKLGSRKVNHKLDKDEILVTAFEGRFTALKFKVEKSDINLHKITVHYRRGRPQSLNIRQTVREGNFSRVIDLKGNRRIIKKVVFWYDTKGYETKKGKVEMWGRH